MTVYTKVNDVSPSKIEPGDRIFSIGVFKSEPLVTYAPVAEVERGYNLNNDLTKITFDSGASLILNEEWKIDLERPETRDERALYIFKNHPNREASVQISGPLYENATRIVGIGKDNLGVVYKED